MANANGLVSWGTIKMPARDAAAEAMRMCAVRTSSVVDLKQPARSLDDARYEARQQREAEHRAELVTAAHGMALGMVLAFRGAGARALQSQPER